MKIVLANSVGVDSRGYYIMHSPSRWSQGVRNFKDLFTYYPWELAYLSSLLKRDTDHDVKLIDGCLRKYNQAEYRTALEKEAPDFLVMEPSTRTLRDDLSLALWAQKMFGSRIIFCGQHATAYPEELIEQGVEYACQGEYEMTVRDIVSGAPRDSILGLYPNARRPLLNVNDLPFPEDTDVARIEYATPGEPNCEYREIQMYATRGCPLMCAFCVAQNLYYGASNHRVRKVESVIDEIALMKSKYPEMEGVFFDEEMHNVDKDFIMSLTEAIRSAGLDGLRYNAMCGHWTLDREMLEAMKSAGYYKIRVGVETADPGAAIGMRLGPKHRLDKLEENLAIAREIGLKVYATFTIGGQGASRDGDRMTGELIRRLVGEGLLADLQISINTPLPGSPFFRNVKRDGYLIDQDWSRFDGGNFAVVSYPNYSKNEIEENFRYALDSYDGGLKLNKSAPFASRFGESMKRIEVKRLKNVLVLRSNRMWQMELLVENLELLAPDAQIDVVGQPAVEEHLKRIPHVRAVFTYTRGFFKHDLFEEEFADRFMKAYDTVIILYSNMKRSGYAEVEEIAASMKPCRILGVFPDGSVTAIP